MVIENDIFKVDYTVGEVVFINHIFVEAKYRRNGYATRIIVYLKKFHKMPVVLHSFPTLAPFYEKLGFRKVCDTNDGYIEFALD